MQLFRAGRAGIAGAGVEGRGRVGGTGLAAIGAGRAGHRGAGRHLFFRGRHVSRQGQTSRVHELLYQAFEAELGGAQVYRAALPPALRARSRPARTWERHHRQSLHHEDMLRAIVRGLELDERIQPPRWRAVAETGKALVNVVELARRNASPADAQIIAAECVLLAETKRNLNRELIGQAAEQLSGDAASLLREAHDAVAAQEDHRLYRTREWARGMWLAAMDFPAVLPPPETGRDGAPAAGAAQAARARGKMM
ncbi:hypothetical protein [Burkholderia gladioli]|uniref:hypothetical protein n=1 Tax=Burkholderia gladioli TaxID=28095 RepID=UPI001F14B26F|nr:hypothetical protein [Burkholderia gladioli]